jgi:DNA polymerase-1
LAFLDERCRDLRSYREALNNRTKFADAPLVAADYNADGRARPSAIIFGTYTGRLTYGSKQGKGVNEKQTGFAIHQEKRDELYRSIVVAPPGYTLMEFDASGQEYRWMAIRANDPVMLGLCLPGEDPHSYMGSRIVGTDYHDMMEQVAQEEPTSMNGRQLGKVANLSLQFRTYPKTLRKVARVQYGIPMELPEAQRIHKTYKQSYTKVPDYWDSAISLAKHRGYAETLAGRRVQLKGDWDGPLGWSMESTSLNFPIQGTGGDQKYLALKLLKDFLVEVGGRFAWDLHDGIYMFIPDAKIEHVAIKGKELLDNLPYQEAWGFTPPIPLPWDCKHGGSWGSLRKWKYA